MTEQDPIERQNVQIYQDGIWSWLAYPYNLRLFGEYFDQVREQVKEEKPDRIKSAYYAFWRCLEETLEPGRERSLALTKAQEAYLWARASLEVQE